MGTREEDWEAVEQLYKSFPGKVWSVGACNQLIRAVPHYPMHATCKLLLNLVPSYQGFP